MSDLLPAIVVAPFPNLLPPVCLVDPVGVVARPVFTVPPSISGTPEQGQTLTGSNGTIVGATSFTRSWLRDGTAIVGAMGSTYLLQAADVGKIIQFEVTASNVIGNTKVDSAGVGPVTAVGVPTLLALGGTFSLVEGSAAATVAGAITGKTSGSTLSLADDAGGRIALSGTNVVAGATATDYETATSHNITIRETLTGATNTPRDTVVSVAVTDVAEAGTALSAATLTRTSSNASGPFTFTNDRPGDWQDGDKSIIRWSSNEDMSSATEGTEVTLSAATTSVNYGAAAAVNTEPLLFQIATWRDTRPAVLNWSTPVGFGDAAAPTISSSASRTAYQFVDGVFTVTANKGGHLVIVGGADQAVFSASGAVLTLEAQNAVRNYLVDVQWESHYGVRSTTQSIAVDNQVNTADAFELGAPETNAAYSTIFESDTVTLNIPSGTPLPITIAGGEYKLNAGAYTSVDGTANDGDALTVRGTSGSEDNQTTSVTPTVGTTSDTFTIATPVGLTTNTTFDPANKAAKAVLSNGNRTLGHDNSFGWAAARTTTAKSGRRYAEFTANSTGWNIGIGFCTASAALVDGYELGSNANSSAIYRSGYHGWGMATGSAGSGGFAFGDVIGVDCVPTSNEMRFYKNGVLLATFTGITFPASYYLAAGVIGYDSAVDPTVIINTGQTAFDSLPSGSQAWDV